MRRKIFMKTAGGGGFPRLARVMTLLVLMLTGLSTGAWADDVLYATVSGTEMTLKYGALPASGATEFTGTSGWNNDFRSTVTTATVDESCKNYAGNNLAHLFYYMQKLTTIEGLANLNTTNVISTRNMFNTCKALTSLDLSAFNTAAVTVMSFMFYNCTALETITVSSGWNTDKVTSSDGMFYNCTKLPNFSTGSTDKANAHTGEGGYLTRRLVPFTATLAPETEDTEHWTISKSEGLTVGQTVTLTYSGSRRVKSVTAVWTPAGGGSETTGNVPEGALNGKFSVSGTKQVYFSKGNLQYDGTNWKFAEHQYDFLTTHDGTSWGHFGWSTSATNYGMSTSTSRTDYSGDFVDWGSNMGEGWYTLSSDEWTYLFDTRTVNGGTGKDKSYTWGQSVNGVVGVVIYPDDYTGSAQAVYILPKATGRLSSQQAVFSCRQPAAGMRLQCTTSVRTAATGPVRPMTRN